MDAEIVDMEESQCIFNTESAYQRRMWRMSVYIQMTVLLDPSWNNRKGCNILRSIEGPLRPQIETFICGTSSIDLFRALVSIPFAESKPALVVEQIHKGTLRLTQIEL